MRFEPETSDPANAGLSISKLSTIPLQPLLVYYIHVCVYISIGTSDKKRYAKIKVQIVEDNLSEL